MLDNLDEHPDVREITTGTIPQAVSVIRQITPGDDSSHRLMILRRARSLEGFGKNRKRVLDALQTQIRRHQEHITAKLFPEWLN
jgi:hypothetical protein